MEELEDYINHADIKSLGTPVSILKIDRREPEAVYTINDAGKLGRNILNDIVANVTGLKAVSGRIVIKVNIGIEDKRWFGDDTTRASELIIEVDLKE